MFQLLKPTAVQCISVLARPEFHGEDKVSAISWRFRLKGENTLLDLIEDGLRAHHYFNKAANDEQLSVADVDIPLPNLRHPKLPTKYAWGGDFRSRGYRWVWDWGTESHHADFTDVVLSKITYEINEGGSVEIEFSVAFNGVELEDDKVYGELCKLAAKGEIYIQLFAPPELMAVKKGYRAGKPDTPQQKGDGNSNQTDLLAGKDGQGGDGGAATGAEGTTDADAGSGDSATAGPDGAANDAGARDTPLKALKRGARGG